MPDWLIVWLGQMQGGIVRTLAAELRAGGLGAAWLAFGLGALHALTPGHGKAALAAFLVGRDAHVGKGVRIALAAAFMHVLTGLAIFIVLQVIVGQVPSIGGRGSPAFALAGYALLAAAGMIMLVQSLRPMRDAHGGERAITAGIGLLPCPLTISVLGFAWAQSTPMQVALVLVSLALGIALTIGLVAVTAILARRVSGVAFAAWLPSLDRWGRIVQGLGGAVIVGLGALAIGRLIL